ncbi:lytic murein transglycosylase [Halomonas getboli]|uniref:lytic murein transglycosylase n=1 Tax=Halomonas getboli TaxID=2935862 RepID=UPI00200025DA|nr:lytic murein transglycosylase [Halomonas getboli]MCK2184822.1 lytic murein transglycosylase [Halomonas getboli]
MLPPLLLLVLLCAGLAGCQGLATPRAEAAPSSSAPAATDVAADRDPAAEQDFAGWRRDFKRMARDEGLSESALTRIDALRYLPRVIELDRRQPEFVRPIWEYLDAAVSPTRVSTGRDRLDAHRQAARLAEARFGVPAEVLMAIWGVESSYGGYQGEVSTLDALATLAYDGRRRDFARGELLAALHILEAGDVPAERMVGSWAGAMGHPQFLPSSYLAHAVDGDGNGRRDIWGSVPDALSSIAAYLAEAGWRADEPWGTEVLLPAGFDYSLTGDTTRRSADDWAVAGVRPRVGESLPALGEAALIAPAGARGPAFLVGHNFRVIRRYNNATSYALAVATLGDAIAGRPGIQGDWPRDEPALKRTQVLELQRRLNARGHEVGEADGILGPNTRRGLRAFQREIGVTPDGFATLGLLERLREMGS